MAQKKPTPREGATGLQALVGKTVTITVQTQTKTIVNSVRNDGGPLYRSILDGPTQVICTPMVSHLMGVIWDVDDRMIAIKISRGAEVVHSTPKAITWINVASIISMVVHG